MLFMDGLAELLSKKIADRVDRDWDEFVEGDNILPDADAMIYSSFQELTEYTLLDRLASHPTVLQAIKDARTTIRENAQDAAEYRRAMSGTVEDQLRYHGMSTKDFV